MSFAENVKRLRKEKNYSQKELAKLVGISQPMINDYENGKKIPSFFTGVELARKLGTTSEELLYGPIAKQPVERTK